MLFFVLAQANTWIFLVRCFLGSRAIKCYVCQGEGSSCKGGNETCPASADRCLKVVGKVGGKTVVDARCASSKDCSTAKTACDASSACEAADCCSSDFCNASPGVLTVTVGALVLSLSAGFFMHNWNSVIFSYTFLSLVYLFLFSNLKEYNCSLLSCMIRIKICTMGQTWSF